MALAMSRQRPRWTSRVVSERSVGLVIGFVLAGAALGFVQASVLPATAAPSAGRLEIRHPGRGHEGHVSGAALAIAPDGPVVAWFAEAGKATHLYVARPGLRNGAPVRVNPDGLTVASAHQPPGLAIGPGGEIYVTWSSPRDDGMLFSQDLRLSRSLDGGRTFDEPLRLNDDRPGSNSFEGLAAGAGDRVVVSWIESHEGSDQVVTLAAVVADRGRRVEQVTRVGEDVCVCCRVAVAEGPGDTVALAWRRVFPGDLRDMVLALSRDGGRSFGAAALVHPDRWRITACPHRGGVVALDGRGRIHIAWYTEGRQNRPDLLFATSRDGRRFSTPLRLHESAGTIPDHLRMAVDGASGRVVVAWQDATAVRRRVLVRVSASGGTAFGPARVLSPAIKAFAPDVAVGPDGRFLVAWHEERFPFLYTVVEPLALPGRS
jgi:hypothetical protein